MKMQPKVDKDVSLATTSNGNVHAASNRDVQPSTNSTERGLSRLEELILMVLIGQQRYGLEIIDLIAQASPGQKRVSVGSLYPALSRLESRGFVISYMEDKLPGARSGACRKYFRITADGSYVLAKARMVRENLADHFHGISIPSLA